MTMGVDPVRLMERDDGMRRPIAWMQGGSLAEKSAHEALPALHYARVDPPGKPA